MFVKTKMKWFLVLCLCLSNHLTTNCHSTSGSRLKTFIVHMDESAMPKMFLDHVEWYKSLIQSVSLGTQVLDDDERNDQRVIYTYDSAFHGIAARLSDEEAEQLAGEKGVVSVLPGRKYKLQTTRSPAFLGLVRRRKENVKFKELDVVVGVVDSGIYPESESFNDTGFTSIPKHWKGACETGRGFEKRHCNKKIIGARSFYRGYEADKRQPINETVEYKSPRDQDGHGTHIAATVAGTPVRGANHFEQAYGTARGMSPGARIAVYKVCWVDKEGDCDSSDILRGIDSAVKDGVNVLSISIADEYPSPYNLDSMSIATFGAMERGIFVSCAAGNFGPDEGTIANVSPWMITVGASSIDRDFPGIVTLGNGKTVTGVSSFKKQRRLSPTTKYPLVYMGSNISNSVNSSLCLEESLDQSLVKGKIVICDRGISHPVEKGQVVKTAGGIGMILVNTVENKKDLISENHIISTVSVGVKEGVQIKNYVLKHRKASASLAFLPTQLGSPSPVVANFSARGPSPISPDILKPDVVAPGFNILAAWPEDASITNLESDTRRVKFNIMSGTSFSCPHVSGVATLLMATHPDWSPAAIKSALMTTAYINDNTFNPLTTDPYDHGAGHINPRRALDPGLVYDIGPQDYFDFLCSKGLTRTELRVFAKYSKRECSKYRRQLNYPTLSVVFPRGKRARKKVTLKRTVTNVGPPNSNYYVQATQFKWVKVRVEPRNLTFVKKFQKLSYKVTFRSISRKVKPEHGGLIWIDGERKVRSQIVVSQL